MESSPVNEKNRGILSVWSALTSLLLYNNLFIFSICCEDHAASSECLIKISWYNFTNCFSMILETRQKYWEHLINFRFYFINFGNDFLNSFILIWTIKLCVKKTVDFAPFDWIGLFVCVKGKSYERHAIARGNQRVKDQFCFKWIFPTKNWRRNGKKMLSAKKSIWLTCYAISDGTRIQLLLSTALKVLD